MSQLNYIHPRKGFQSHIDSDFKINTADMGNSGWDLKRFYGNGKLPNGKPMPKGYSRKLPYRSNS